MAKAGRKETTSETRESRSSLFEDIAGFFTSVRTTISLLFLLAVASILGTVIPQEAGLEHFQAASSPLVYRLVVILDLHNMYRSWWFLALLGLLSLNLLACLIKRVQSIPAEWTDNPPRNSFAFTLSDARKPDTIKDILQEKLSALVGTQPVPVTTGNGLSLVWAKHRIYLLGFPLIHSAIILILIGGLVGLLYGFKGHVQIEEGKEAAEFVENPSGRVRELPFTIAVDAFTLTRYPTGHPKEYRSDVRLLKGDKVVEKGPILVNHPMTLDRISLYQSDYRLIGIKEVRVALTDSSGKAKEIALRPRTAAEVSGTPYSLKLTGLDPGATKRGPGVELDVLAPGEQPRKLKVFGGDPEPGKFGDFTVRFVDYAALYATGLQVAYDPGTVIVWAGCLALIAGFILTLFTNHRRVSLSVEQTGDKTVVRVSGRSRRMRKEFREQVEGRVRELLERKGP